MIWRLTGNRSIYLLDCSILLIERIVRYWRAQFLRSRHRELEQISARTSVTFSLISSILLARILAGWVAHGPTGASRSGTAAALLQVQLGRPVSIADGLVNRKHR